MCTEIADEPEIVARCKQLFEQVERGITPATVLFPWFPSPSMVMRIRATKQLYDIIVKAVKVRKQSGVPQNDTLQIFLNSGDELTTIVGVWMSLSGVPPYSRLRHSVYDGPRNGRIASDWYCRRVRHVMPSRYRRS
jgi:hypothetical protein